MLGFMQRRIRVCLFCLVMMIINNDYDDDDDDDDAKAVMIAPAGRPTPNVARFSAPKSQEGITNTMVLLLFLKVNERASAVPLL